jgi:hypothetical protein
MNILSCEGSGLATGKDFHQLPINNIYISILILMGNRLEGPIWRLEEDKETRNQMNESCIRSGSYEKGT